MITRYEWSILTQALEQSPDVEERLDAACRLGGWGLPGTAAILVKALQREKDPVIREAIAGSLLLCDVEELVTELVPFLTSDEPMLRRLALEILAYKVEDRYPEVLEELLPTANKM